MSDLEQFGRYELKQKIGQGGMASVFLGYDPRFKREVAIKVLPPQFTHDPMFRERFQREAQMIAGLDHPAIVPVYDYGEEKGQPYIVMRYMPGGSLSDRLAKGPLPLSEVTVILERLGAALDRAHSHGVIHRDLKPGNVLFDQYGDAFLADFGIAKMAEATAALTGSSIIGTPAYMSPEQVKGESLDGRSDIYTLGVMLFEMLTGEQPYEAATPIAVAIKHIQDPVPDVRILRADIAPNIHQTINRAMSKNVSERFGTASELVLSVKTSSQIMDREEVAEPSFYEPIEVDAFTEILDEEQILPVQQYYEPAPVPQKSRIPQPKMVQPPPSVAVEAKKGGATKLLIGVLALAGVSIIAFALFNMFTGGDDSNVGETATAASVAGVDSTAVSQTATALAVASGQIAADEMATTKAVESAAVSATSEAESFATVEAMSAAQTMTAEPTATLEPTSTPTVVPTPLGGGRGQLVFVSERVGNEELFLVGVDGSGLTRLTFNDSSDWFPTWSPDGSKIVFESTRGDENDIYIIDADGANEQRLTKHEALDKTPVWSPDGSRIAFRSNRDGAFEIYTIGIDGTGLLRLTNDSTYDGSPAWSPDGSKIVFDSLRDGNGTIYVMNADGSDPVRLTDPAVSDGVPSWSPDGSQIAFVTLRDGNGEIYVMDPDGSNLIRLTENDTADWYPMWSPDSTQIVFRSERDGNMEIYIMNADGTNQTRITNNDAKDKVAAWRP